MPTAAPRPLAEAETQARAQKGDVKPVTSIARILTDKGIKSEEVLKHFAITLDVDITKPVQIASPQLDKASEAYMAQLNLAVIEGRDFGTIKKDSRRSSMNTRSEKTHRIAFLHR